MKHTLLANGRRIAYRLDGPEKGLRLVLLHGFCEDASLWDGLLPRLGSLPVLRVDLPGFGASDLPANAGMDVYADAVCSVLNDLSVEKCVLVGHSMGGYTALEFGEKYPERLSGLGLFHSHPFEDSPERREARQRSIDLIRSGRRDLYLTQFFPGLFAEIFAQNNPQLIRDLTEKAKRAPAEGIVYGLEGMMERKNHEQTLRDAACPVLFVFGETDALVPPEQGLKAAAWPNIADVHLLSGVGHMAMFESVEKSAEIVRRFWEFCAVQ